MARLYRRFVTLLGCQFLVMAVAVMTLSDPPFTAAETLLAWGYGVAYVGIVAVLVVTAYGLTKRLAAGTPVVLAMGMLVSPLNIVVFFTLTGKAQAWWKARGIPFGFLGPKLNRPESV